MEIERIRQTATSTKNMTPDQAGELNNQLNRIMHVQSYLLLGLVHIIAKKTRYLAIDLESCLRSRIGEPVVYGVDVRTDQNTLNAASITKDLNVADANDALMLGIMGGMGNTGDFAFLADWMELNMERTNRYRGVDSGLSNVGPKSMDMEWSAIKERGGTGRGHDNDDSIEVGRGGTVVVVVV